MSADYDMLSEAMTGLEKEVHTQDGRVKHVVVAAPEDFEGRVDSLFGAKPSYQLIKHERPEHRLILWLKLQSHSTEEIAAQTGYTKVHIRNICKQPWFIENFCRLAKEIGTDAVKTFLEGEVMPALVRTVALAQDSKVDAVKLAANKEILDRFLGKSVVRAEVNSTSKSTVEITHDITKLQEEERKLNEQLRAVGIGLPSS